MASRKVKTLDEISRQHPKPWSVALNPPNTYVILDKSGQAVELFTIIDFVLQVTAREVNE